MLSSLFIFICGPVAQNEHFKASGDLSIIGLGNSHRVDLNMNFPDRPKPRNVIQPETEAVMNWITSHFFVLSGSIREGTAKCRFWVIMSFVFNKTK